MTRQINLLKRPPASRSPFIGLLLISSVVVLSVAGFWWYLHQQNAQLQWQLSQSQAVTAKLRADIVRLSTSQDELTRIKAEIVLLQPQYEATKDFVANVRSGPLGRPDGYSGTLELLGQVPTTDTWLTAIELRHKGRPMGLTGMALSDHAAGAYAARLNKWLDGSSFKLQGMELSRQMARQDGQTSKPPAVIFKLN